MKNNLLKSLTLSLFIILIIGFVAYRSGWFNEKTTKQETITPEQYQLNPTGTVPSDTVIESPTMLSTSKSIQVTEPKVTLPQK